MFIKVQILNNKQQKACVSLKMRFAAIRANDFFQILQTLIQQRSVQMLLEHFFVREDYIKQHRCDYWLDIWLSPLS